MHIKAKTAGKAWLFYVNHVCESGITVEDDREDIVEARPVFVEIAGVDLKDPVIARYGDRQVIDLYRKKCSRKILYLNSIQLTGIGCLTIKA